MAESAVLGPCTWSHSPLKVRCLVQGDGQMVGAWTLRPAVFFYSLVLPGWRRQWTLRPAVFFYSLVFQGDGQVVGAWTWRPAVFCFVGHANPYDLRSFTLCLGLQKDGVEVVFLLLRLCWQNGGCRHRGLCSFSPCGVPGEPFFLVAVAGVFIMLMLEAWTLP